MKKMSLVLLSAVLSLTCLSALGKDTSGTPSVNCTPRFAVCLNNATESLATCYARTGETDISKVVSADIACTTISTSRNCLASTITSATNRTMQCLVTSTGAIANIGLASVMSTFCGGNPVSSVLTYLKCE